MSQAFDDLQQAVSDIQDNVGDFTQDDFNNLSDTVQTHDDAITDIQNNGAQLQFPLNQDTINLIRQLFPIGNTQLGVGGTVTLTDSRVSSGSILVLTNTGISGATQGTLSYVATNASTNNLVISSSSSTDRSFISYIIFN